MLKSNEIKKDIKTMLKSNEIKQAITFVNSIAALNDTELKSQFQKLPANVQNKIKSAIIKSAK